MTDEQLDEQIPRRFRRWNVTIQAVVRIENEPRICTIFDISEGGAWIALEDATQDTVGATAELDLEDFPPIPAEIRHKARNTLGLMFLHDGEAEAELDRYLVSRRPERAEPRKPIGIEAALILRTACTVWNISRLGANLAIDEVAHLSVGDGESGAQARDVQHGARHPLAKRDQEPVDADRFPQFRTLGVARDQIAAKLRFRLAVVKEQQSQRVFRLMADLCGNQRGILEIEFGRRADRGLGGIFRFNPRPARRDVKDGACPWIIFDPDDALDVYGPSAVLARYRLVRLFIRHFRPPG